MRRRLNRSGWRLWAVPSGWDWRCCMCVYIPMKICLQSRRQNIPHRRLACRPSSDLAPSTLDQSALLKRSQNRCQTDFVACLHLLCCRTLLPTAILSDQSLSQPAPQSPLSMLFEGILPTHPARRRATPHTLLRSPREGIPVCTRQRLRLQLAAFSSATRIRGGSEFTNRGEEGGWEDSLLFASCFALSLPLWIARGGVQQRLHHQQHLHPSHPRPTSPNLDGGTEKLPLPPHQTKSSRQNVPLDHLAAVSLLCTRKRWVLGMVEGLVGERGGLSLRSRRKSPREYLAPILARQAEHACSAYESLRG